MEKIKSRDSGEVFFGFWFLFFVFLTPSLYCCLSSWGLAFLFLILLCAPVVCITLISMCLGFVLKRRDIFSYFIPSFLKIQRAPIYYLLTLCSSGDTNFCLVRPVDNPGCKINIYAARLAILYKRNEAIIIHGDPSVRFTLNGPRGTHPRRLILAPVQELGQRLESWSWNWSEPRGKRAWTAWTAWTAWRAA